MELKEIIEIAVCVAVVLVLILVRNVIIKEYRRNRKNKDN